MDTGHFRENRRVAYSGVTVKTRRCCSLSRLSKMRAKRLEAADWRISLRLVYEPYNLRPESVKVGPLGPKGPFNA